MAITLEEQFPYVGAPSFRHSASDGCEANLPVASMIL